MGLCVCGDPVGQSDAEPVTVEVFWVQFSYASRLFCSPANLLAFLSVRQMLFSIYLFPHSLILFSVSTLILNPHQKS